MPNSETVIRDPLYGFIKLNERELAILQSKPMQRLRNIKQLGNTSLVYPSGNHTRFEHSLGAFHLAGEICSKIRLPKDCVQNVKFAALLHDSGHGAYSHLFETALKTINDDPNISHEDITVKIIREDPTISSEIKKPDEVLDCFKDTQSIEASIISSELDCDRMDYLRRDSYHVGVAYGLYDIPRIMENLVHRNSGKQSYLAIQKKAMDAVENYRLARYAMFKQVYSHHSVIACDSMLERAIEISSKNGSMKKMVLKVSNRKFLEEYLNLDDSKLINILKNDKNEDVRNIMIHYTNRQIYKRACEKSLKYYDPDKTYKLQKMKRDDFSNIEKEIANQCDCEKYEIIAKLSVLNNKSYKESVWVYSKENKLEQFNNLSPIKGEEHLPSTFFVFCPPEKRDAVKKYLCKNIGGIIDNLNIES